MALAFCSCDRLSLRLWSRLLGSVPEPLDAGLAAEPLEASVGTYAQLADPQGATFGVIELMPELRTLEI